MPIIEFKCDSCGKVQEKILPFSKVKDKMSTPCLQCGGKAPRILFSVPLPAHFLGNPDGYHKPSPTKRYSYKLAAERGNENSAG